mgnify:CR=1 FL=1
MPEMSVSAAGTVTKVKMTNKMVIIVFILPFMSFSSVSCHWGIGARSAAANSAAMHRRAGKSTKVVTAKNAVRIHSRIFSNKLPGVFMPAAVPSWPGAVGPLICLLFILTRNLGISIFSCQSFCGCDIITVTAGLCSARSY